MSPFKQERGRGRRKRTGSATASRTTSGAGSDDGCDGCQASAEPDEGGQSQRGSLPLVEEWIGPGMGHGLAPEGWVLVRSFCYTNAYTLQHRALCFCTKWCLATLCCPTSCPKPSLSLPYAALMRVLSPVIYFIFLFHFISFHFICSSCLI